MDKHRVTQKGFTLIEILIVVALIGIIASIAIPVYHDYVDRARNAAALSDLKNLKSGLEAFFSEQQHYPVAP